MKYREAAVAGRFYPATLPELTSQMDDYFNIEPSLTVVPKALIVPHAGYFYSGEVAATAYRVLRRASGIFSRVILLGPSHHVAFEGGAVPVSDVFTTPIGDVEIDRQGADELVEQGLAVHSEQAHHWEHSLEVQLPFLQYCLDNFILLPVVVGHCQPDSVAQIIDYAMAQPDTLIVVSSDLSHYHPYVEAKNIDTNTIEHVISFQSDIQPKQACGCYSINGLLHYAHQHHWKIDCINYTNSGDVLAQHEHRSPIDSEEVVGYASFVLF